MPSQSPGIIDVHAVRTINHATQHAAATDSCAAFAHHYSDGHSDQEAGGRPTQHAVGVLLLLEISHRCHHSKQYRPIHEMPGAASASVRDFTPTHGAGVTNSNWSGVHRKK